MKEKLRKKFNKIFPPEYDIVWMIVLPCLAVLLCFLLLKPQLSGLLGYVSEKYAVSQTAAESTETPYIPYVPEDMPSLQPRQQDECPPDPENIRLEVSSVEKDMYVVLRDEHNQVVTGREYELLVISPDGNEAIYRTNDAGSCHIVELAPGLYCVSLSDGDGSPVECEVRAELSYTPIDNISEEINIVDVSQLSADEVKANSATARREVAPELIQTYSYTFHLGVNGCLLYRDTDQESDVVPIDENGDGTPDYGIRTDSGGETVSVALYNADNTPVSLYAIDAVSLGSGWKTENGKVYYSENGKNAVGLKKIKGKLYYFNERGEKAKALGIDVSCFNGNIDWKAIREQGIDFVYLRVGGRGWSSGTVYKDSYIRKNLQGAKSVGLKTGVYFYSTAIHPIEAVQEASVVLDELSGAHLDCPIYIDREYSGSYPRGRADRLNAAQHTEIIKAFCETVISAGYSAGVYANEYYVRHALDAKSLSRYSLWLASYTENNALPPYSGRYDLWQFTDRAQISGIAGTVDMNIQF